MSREFWLAVFAVFTAVGAYVYYRLPDSTPPPSTHTSKPEIPLNLGGRPAVQGADGNATSGGEDTEGVGHHPFRDGPVSE